MKKLNNPIPDGGFPLFGEDINELFQNEIWTVIEAMLGTEGNIIISGGQVTNEADKSITEGICFLGGEFYRFPAASGLGSEFYISPSPTSFEQRVFEDTNLKDFIEVKVAQITTTDPGGELIKVDFVNGVRRFGGVTPWINLRALDTSEPNVVIDLSNAFCRLEPNGIVRFKGFFQVNQLSTSIPAIQRVFRMPEEIVLPSGGFRFAAHFQDFGNAEFKAFDFSSSSQEFFTNTQNSVGVFDYYIDGLVLAT